MTRTSRMTMAHGLDEGRINLEEILGRSRPVSGAELASAPLVRSGFEMSQYVARSSERVSRALLALLAIACVSASGAASRLPSLDQALAEASGWLSQGRYLAASETLQRFAIDAHGKIRDLRAFLLWNQFQVEISGEPWQATDVSADDNESAMAIQLSGASVRPAIASIVDGAKGTRIVILNEDHIHPRQRAFALQLAKALRPLGYDVLAVETLNNAGDSASRMAALQRRGYLVMSDGFYTRDPVFADFVRQALRIGYIPASYEHLAADKTSGDERFEAREQGQAENLAAILKEHPHSKLFIYAGESHIAKSPVANGDEKRSWMAERLAKLTGVDPFSVDQTTLESDCSICRRLSRKMSGPLSFFRRSVPIVVGEYRGAVDLQVFKPQEGRMRGRPGWLPGMGRIPVAVPPNLLPRHGRRLVQAFVASESRDAIPLDQFVVSAGKSPPPFMLRRVRVRYSFQ